MGGWLDFVAFGFVFRRDSFCRLYTGNYCHWSSTQNPKNSNYYNRERLHDGLVCNGIGSDENKNSTKNYTRAVKELRTDGSTTLVESVSLSHSSAEIKVGETLLLTATVMPTYANYNYNIVWSSSDNSIASVNNGLVTGVSLGNATITASAGGKNATCNVSIVEESSNSVETVSADATQSYNYLGGSNVYSATLKGKASISGYWDLDTYFYYSESYNTLSALRMSGTRVNGSSNAQSFEATLENLDENTTYYYVACVNLKKNGTTYDKLFGEVKSFTTPEYYLPPYVDLGLPSGVKWGVMNLGATNPTESGRSVSWGVGNGNGNSNYQTGKVLPLEEDIAHLSLGGYWRTPTREEWVELFTYCKCSYRVGSSGMTVSRNGRTILIPLNDYWSSTCATAYSRSSTGGYSVATAYALWGNSEHFKTYIEKKILNTNTAITSSGKIRPVYVDR